MINQIVKTKIVESIKNNDERTLSVMRLLLSALEYSAIDAVDRKLTPEQEIEIVKREVKKRTEAAEAYLKAGREDKAEMEIQEREILKQFLPDSLDEGEILNLIRQGRESGAADIGSIMKFIKDHSLGKIVDGKLASELVRKELAS